MKAIILTGLMVMLTTVSCQSMKQKPAEDKPLQFKGDWEITSINFEKGYQLKPFDENADSKCFIGSYWKFVPNNNTGRYLLNAGGDCPVKEQSIKFELTANNEFKFKKLQNQVKAKNITEGYILQFEKQDADHFVLIQEVPFEGKMMKAYYYFTRTSIK